VGALRKLKALAVLAVAAEGLYAYHAAAVGTVAAQGKAAMAAAKAISYARAQIGTPYMWGGPTAPGTSGGFDCSGLVMMAYRSAGVSIARTSQQQWATERHVSSPRPGDLVFYAGADGTQTSPGHVALVVGGGKMIEAYATGYPVREVPIRPGAAGYTDPAAGSAA
jgi:cell wall-associated NlpC family hydrolase